MNLFRAHGYHGPSIDHEFLEAFPLVPTSFENLEGKIIPFEGYQPMMKVMFALNSLSSLPPRYNEKHIVDQLEFMIEAAKNSIRPDKVHELIRIIKRVTSEGYGEYHNCLEIQKKIKDEARKRQLSKKVRELKERYPISNNLYKPFIPKWAENICPRDQIWNFFLLGKFLDPEKYPDHEIFNFSGGVPINFEL